ncbi:MAG: hypothetical protein F2782_01170, partial [Actinobacteria bacterium]|nr:hypothetical protein [Actinomycetota bacterium]
MPKDVIDPEDELETDDDLEGDEIEDDLDEEADPLIDSVLDDDLLAVEGVDDNPADISTDDDLDDDDDQTVVVLEDELHPDDVEASLDILLKEKTTSDRPEDEDLEDAESEADRVEGTNKVKPRGDDEFLCDSCFLV